MDINLVAVESVSSELNLSKIKVLKTLELLIKESCTIPFISRYRKEATGGLDEVQVAAIEDGYNIYIETEKRREFVLATIKEQGKLTKDLEKAIIQATSISILDDLYAPYKQKKKTKGDIALEQGLGPLKEEVLNGKFSLEEISKLAQEKYLNEDVKDIDAALDGVKAIIIDELVRDPEIKAEIREVFWKQGKFISSKRKDAEKIKDYDKFKDYFEYEQKISDLTNPKLSHRFLAMKRGLSLKILKVEAVIEEELGQKITGSKIDLNSNKVASFVEDCIKRAYKNYIQTSLDLEIKSEIKKHSDESAINVFGVNLKNLLLQPYLGPKAVLGIDPGVRTGCKIAAIDNNGNYVIDTVIYPFEPQRKTTEAINIVQTLLEKFDIKHVAVGNGTFGRETLDFIKSNVERIQSGKTSAVLVNEDGASIYSASDIAREEFPDKDVTVRGAVSIARRFQDPLAELVKIDPKSIGVGQYQHDVNQSKLKKSLSAVVETCVNFVGVDLNTASAPLLAYISGIGPSLAKNIVKYREKIGGFKSREEILSIPRFSEKIFEQSAGFLRIYNSAHPLDGTFIHPERYEAIEKWCSDNKVEVKSLVEDKELITKLEKDNSLKETLGQYTHDDIVKSLLSPSQDPRSTFQSFEYAKGLKDITDLKQDAWYPGLVTNITQFGAFVDLGIKENGLVHISQMADKFVEDPLTVLKVGQEVKARVMEVDPQRKRISLSLKLGTKEEGLSRNNSGNKKQSRPTQNKTNKPEKIKNNAFAGLKNLKL